MEHDLLKELYRIYGRELYRYLFAFCGDRMLAEDILQETFCKALLSLPDSHPNIRAWLYKVGRNLMINEIRRNKREEPDSDSVARAREEKDGDRTDPAAELVVREEKERLKKALDRLDERKRDVLILQYYEHFTLREAAVILGISHENARVLSLRAKRELRRIMEVNGYEVP